MAKILRDQENAWILFFSFLSKKADLCQKYIVILLPFKGTDNCLAIAFWFVKSFMAVEKGWTIIYLWYPPLWCTTVSGSTLSRTMSGWTVLVEWAGTEEISLYSIRRYQHNVGCSSKGAARRMQSWRSQQPTCLTGERSEKWSGVPIKVLPHVPAIVW